MLFPFTSRRASPWSGVQARKVELGTRRSAAKLDIRAGGGGGGGGGRGGGGGGGGGGSRGGSSSGSGGSSSGSKGGSGGSSGSSGSSSGSKGGSTTVDTNSGLGSRPASVSSSGGGSITTIPGGSPFAGRSVGGGSRGQIYGTGAYGSGYPGVIGRGTIGRGFPFYFWPVVWWYGPDYLHPDEYGTPDNSTRPGGALSTAAFTNQTTTLRVLSDNSTVSILIDQITGSCGSYVQGSSAITPTSYINSSSSFPRPEQAIQYYRASSIVLSLDGYNNTDALSANDSSSQDIPLPSGINTDFVNCINTTIGNAAPLVDTSSSSGALAWSPPSTVGFVSLVWLLWMFMASV